MKRMKNLPRGGQRAVVRGRIKGTRRLANQPASRERTTKQYEFRKQKAVVRGRTSGGALANQRQNFVRRKRASSATKKRGRIARKGKLYARGYRAGYSAGRRRKMSRARRLGTKGGSCYFEAVTRPPLKQKHISWGRTK